MIHIVYNISAWLYANTGSPQLIFTGQIVYVII